MQSNLANIHNREIAVLNEDKMKGKWTEIKGEIKTQWGKMTDDELDQTSGNLVSILGLIQQRYGEKKEEVQGQLARIAAKFSQKTEDIKNDLKAGNKNSH